MFTLPLQSLYESVIIRGNRCGNVHIELVVHKYTWKYLMLSLFFQNPIPPKKVNKSDFFFFFFVSSILIVYFFLYSFLSPDTAIRLLARSGLFVVFFLVGFLFLIEPSLVTLTARTSVCLLA